MAYPSFVAAGAKAAGTTAAVSVPLPTGIQSGDLIFLIASTIAGGNISITVTGGFNWTLLQSQDVTGGEKLFIWYAWYIGTQTAPSVQASSDHICAATAAFRGVAPNNFMEGLTSGTTASSTSQSFATNQNTNGAERLCIISSSTGADSNTAQHSAQANTSLTGVAERVDYNTNSGGGGGFQLASGEKATAGSQGTWTWTLATASATAVITFALAPRVNITLTPDTAQTTFTGVAPNIELSVNLTPDKATSNLTGVAPTIEITTPEVTISPDIATEVLSGVNPQISLETLIFPDKAQTQFSGVSPDIFLDIVLEPDVATTTLLSSTADIHLDILLSPDISEQTILTTYPDILLDVSLTPDIAQTILEQTSSNLQIDTNITSDTSYSTLNGINPEITLDVLLTPQAAIEILDGITPIIAILPGELIITPQIATLVLDGVNPDLVDDRLVEVENVLQTLLEGVLPKFTQTTIYPPYKVKAIVLRYLTEKAYLNKILAKSVKCKKNNKEGG